MASLARSDLVVLSAAEVASLLSPAEFAKLCDLVDRQFGKSVTEVSNLTGMVPRFATRKLPVQFDVVEVTRRADGEVEVLVCPEGRSAAARIVVS